MQTPSCPCGFAEDAESLAAVFRLKINYLQLYSLLSQEKTHIPFLHHLVYF
jgi:hypothetical protein